MRIAVLADIHGNVRALEAVLAHLGSAKFDCVVDLGDSVAGPLWPRETLMLLDRLGAVSVRGNHERQAIDRTPHEMGPSDRYTFEQLSEAERVRLGARPTTVRLGGDILACHASPHCDMTYLSDTPCDGRLIPATAAELDDRVAAVGAALILCGHSHQPNFGRADPSGVWVCNPGSVGLPAYRDNGHVSETSSPHARYAVVEWSQGIASATLHHVAYDWEAAARRAEENGRPDWAWSLRTGTADRA